MAVPFSMRWEVSGFPWAHGSFTQAAKVRPFGRTETGDFWVLRPVEGLKPAHRARVLRRWYLGTQLRQPAWPRVVDTGDEGDDPWIVVEAPGSRVDGALRAPDARAGVADVRGLAAAVAEAEALLARHFTRARLSLRPSLLARDARGRLKLQLAALDVEADEGFPALPETMLVTPESLWATPPGPATDVFALGWVLALVVGGKWPWALDVDASAGETDAREALGRAVLEGRLKLELPTGLEGLGPVLKRALAASPGLRYPDAAAFADALAPFAPSVPRPREATVGRVSMAAPAFDACDEALPSGTVARLVGALEVAATWSDLADALDEVKSPRAAFIRAQLRGEGGDEAVRAALTPAGGEGEALRCEWKWGYVRALEVTSTAKGDVEAHARAATRLLAHPSLRFVQTLKLSGRPEHTRGWAEALHRDMPPALRRLESSAFEARDAFALETGFRFPRLTCAWTGTGGGLLRRLFGG